MRVSLLRRMAGAAAAVVGKQHPKEVIAGKGTKPVLRGWLGAETKMHAIICFSLAISVGVAYRYFISEPRKKRYAEFWRTYDDHADFKRMVKAGWIYPDISIEDVEAMEKETIKEMQKKGL